MKSRRIRLASQPLWIIGAAVACMVIQAVPALAQQRAPQPSQRPDPFSEIRERRQRETALRGAEIVRGKSKSDPRQTEAIVDQMREDYKRLQVVRNEMVRALTSDKTLDYKRIADRTAEINKRASRLQGALALHNPDSVGKKQTTPVELDDEQLKAALVNLCNGIIGFVENPMFKSPGVVDVQETTKASRLLQNIIDLSSDIRKNAGKHRPD